jgi:hypothetical protein
MKTVVQYRWRVWWIKKWVTTSYHSTEEDIRVEHPEAEPVLGTGRVLTIPESPQEIAARELQMSAGHVYRGFKEER